MYTLFVKAESNLALNNRVMMLVVYGCILAISWFGARFIVAGSLTTGNLTSLFSYVMSVLMSLMMLSMVFVMITMSAASGRRIAEVLNEEPDMNGSDRPETEVRDGRIDFNHVSFSYKHGSGEKVLRDINIHIRSGETVGIIGGTGCGKSSLVSLISRLYDVDEGSVCVGGRDVRDYDMEEMCIRDRFKSGGDGRCHPDRPAGQGPFRPCGCTAGAEECAGHCHDVFLGKRCGTPPPCAGDHSGIRKSTRCQA